MKWSPWRSFPNPDDGDIITAPFGPGCYELRHKSSKQLVLFGMGGHVAHRMSSLLPPPHGCGTRNSAAKRRHVWENLSDIEYRTAACASVEAAKEAERSLKKNKHLYLFTA